MYKALLPVAFMLTFSLTAPSVASDTTVSAKTNAAFTVVEGISEFRLANGLRVLFAPDASRSTITVNMTYLVGSRHENYGETGMAHLLEHLMFKGTTNRSNILQELSKREMRFNGTTYYDRTNYYETFPANEDNLTWLLEMEADRMVNSRIAKSDLDSEFSVVRNEMESGENSPSRALVKQMEAVSFDWHNYGHNTIGARSDVENVKIENLQKFYKKYYQPDNAVLIVAGKFDPVATLEKIRRTFGKIARPERVLVPTWTREPPRDGAREITVQRVGNVQLAALLYPISSGSHPDSAAISALSLILGDNKKGRLYESLLETKKAIDVQSTSLNLAEPGYMMFMTQLSKDQSTAEARRVLISTVEGLAARPITDAELKRAKTWLQNEFIKSINDPQRLCLEMSEYIAQGDWRLFFIQRDRVEKLTVADIQRVAGNYLKETNRTFGQYLPVTQVDRAVIPASPDVAQLVAGYKGRSMVAEGEAFDTTPGGIDRRTERSTLKNGAKLALLSKKTRGETVKGHLTLRLGDEPTLVGKATVSSLAAEMLLRGTTGLSRAGISDRLAELGTRLTIRPAGQSVVVQFDSTREHLPEVLKLLEQILRAPAFPEKEFSFLVKEKLAQVEGQRNEPRAVAMQAIGKARNVLYKSDDIRYSRSFDEYASDLRSVTIDEIRRFHQEFYGATNAEIALVGDFDSKEVRSQLEALMGTWNSRAAYKWIPDLPQVATGGVQTITTPDKPNAFYVARLPLSLKDTDPDYAPLLVANKILGGGIRSRLVDRLRHKDGLSYGVASQFSVSSHDPVSSVTLTATFAPDNFARLRAGVEEELADFVKNGVTNEELADAKLALAGERKVGRAQDSTLAAALTGQLGLGRTMAFSAELDATIARLSLDEVNAAIRKHVQPAKFSHVFAGDFKQTAMN